MMAISTETEAEAEVSKALKEGGVTVEYQRKKAKEMVKFFKQQQYNQAVEDSQVFMTPKNESTTARTVRPSGGDDDRVRDRRGLHRPDQAHHLGDGHADVYD